MAKKKLTGLSLSTPFGGVGASWSESDNTKGLANAKAFESGRVLMGAYVAFKMDKDIEEYNGYLERIAVYLEDLGVKDINMEGYKPRMTYEDYVNTVTPINNQLWGKGGKLGLHFENAMHMFLVLNDNIKFKELALELDIPDKLLKETSSPLELFQSIRNYYEGLIFEKNNF